MKFSDNRQPEEEFTRIFVCPVCGTRYLKTVSVKLNDGMRRHFPATYGNGYLICDICLAIRLEEIKAK